MSRLQKRLLEVCAEQTNGVTACHARLGSPTQKFVTAQDGSVCLRE